MLDLIGLPQNLTGKTVLDIGMSDGFFARELFLRGAAVTCIDYRDKNSHGFAVMEQLLSHEFPYHQMSVYGIDADKLGVFDYVVFLGVLYHLPDMISALVKVRSVCREGMFLETQSEEFGQRPTRALLSRRNTCRRPNQLLGSQSGMCATHASRRGFRGNS